MPTIVVEVFPERTWEQKQALVRNLTEAVTESLGNDANLVKVRLNKIPRQHATIGGMMQGDPPAGVQFPGRGSHASQA